MQLIVPSDAEQAVIDELYLYFAIGTSIRGSNGRVLEEGNALDRFGRVLADVG